MEQRKQPIKEHARINEDHEAPMHEKKKEIAKAILLLSDEECELIILLLTFLHS